MSDAAIENDESQTTDVGVNITEAAQVYLKDLLSKQDCEGIGVRMHIQYPGTPRAETCLSYCRPGEEQEGDVRVEYPDFPALFEKRSVPFLDEALVDYDSDKFGGQLTIKAPNSKMPRVSEDSPIEDKITYVLWNDINPQLAAHGGEVSLVKMDGMVAVLQFGGGCQGCSAVDVTLKEGVEKTLMEKVEGLEGVKDATDHSDTSQAYY
jgi:Fe/S biogenesis protein NfuA